MKSLGAMIRSLLCVVLLSVSCSESFLETKPLGELSSADVWADPSLSQAFINGIYNDLEHSFAKHMKSVFVDDGHRRDNTAVLNFNRSQLTADLIPGWNNQPTWSSCYRRIRRCNLFLGNVDVADAPFENSGLLIGEALFLRAWNYYILTSMFGGVPVISKAYGLDDDFNVPRNSYAECIQFIVEDLDRAADLLPIIQTGNDDGRATKGAALALKSRILLYAASDLYNTAVYPQYPNPELVQYTDGNRTERWHAAKAAAKAVMDLNQYSLFRAEPALGDSVAQNYVDLFLTKQTEEDIWVRYYTSATIKNDNNLLVMNGPNGYGGQGNNAVTGNLVDAFEMSDGTKFDWKKPLHAELPYNGREPRFYAYILFEGAKWTVRPAYSAHLDPKGIVHVGYYERWDDKNNRVYIEPGIDSRNSPFQPNNSGQTLYLARKFLDPNVEAVEGGRGQDVPYRLLRYTEVLLNYAEACLGLGEEEEARTYINMVRKRAGLPNLTESGLDLVKRYRNERRIELMYEDHRFFDVRRWLTGPESYGPIYKANVLYKLLPDKTTSSIPTIFHEVLETRAWDNKAYFFPINRDEVNRNNSLVQNPGY